VLLSGELTETPRRVVSLNPSINEFLLVAGVGDRLVGVDVWSYRPREARKIPRVGSFTGVDINAVVSLSPDLVILYYPVQRHLVDTLAKVAPVLAIPTPVNLDAVVSTFKFLGALLDIDEEADRIAGIYRDLVRGDLNLEDLLVVMYLGGYDFACLGSYIASILIAVSAGYVKLRCVMKFLEKARDAAALLDEVNPSFLIYEGKTKAFREIELDWIRGSRCRACIDGKVLTTPNDTLAHYGPSLPLDLRLIIDAIKRGARFVGNTSSIRLPSVRDDWYSPYR